MISFGSGADALTFDSIHIILFLLLVVLTAVVMWMRQTFNARHSGQVIMQEAETATLRGRLEGELESANRRADEDARRFAAKQAEWNEERGRLEAQRVEERTRLEAQWKEDRATLSNRVEELSKRAETAENRLAAYEAQSEERAKAVEAERQSLRAMAEDVQKRFQHLADEALRKSQNQFIEMADQHLKKHKEGAEGELKKLMQPIQESFGHFHEKVESIQKITAEERSSMKEQMRNLMENVTATQKTTSDLANALRAPKGGGRWGEETLRNVLEMAGLSPFCDFTEQTHTANENGAIRPDVTVSMPGGRQLVIDSKVSVDSYLSATETEEVSERQTHLTAHARNIRKHIETLGKKSYWDKLQDTVDFVAMFIPGENFYAAALEEDRSLFDFAAKNRVIIVTPSTLIALAKAVAYGWRQEEAAKNAREVTDMARELYSRLSVFGGHVAKLGRNISQSANSYNDLVGSLEGKVMPQARKFEAMGFNSDGKALPKLEEIEDRTRELKQGRDLLFSEIDKADAENTPRDKPRRRA